VTDSYAYDEFGRLTQHQGPSGQPFAFAGQPRDPETGLTYLRARYYDPSTGRFMQRDRLAGRKARPCTLSRYAYVCNNPINDTDPSGLQDEALELAVGISPPPPPPPPEPPEQEPVATESVTDISVVGETPGGLTYSVSEKIASQMGARGWDLTMIEQTIDNPATTITTWDRTGGVPWQPATAYYRDDYLNHVTVNDLTGKIVQISDQNKPDWIGQIDPRSIDVRYGP
jgi:RHS repeat-associated protein